MQCGQHDPASVLPVLRREWAKAGADLPATAPTSFYTCGRQRQLPMLPAHTRPDAFVSLCSCRFLPQATEVLM